MPKKTLESTGLTTVVTVEEKKDEEIRVPVLLPELPGGEGGMKVDQYEHVTIANEEKETCYKVLRGVQTDVTVPVFMQLKQRYPRL